MDQASADIETIITWLKGNDDDLWDDHVGILAEDVMSTLGQIAGGLKRNDKTGTRSAEAPVHNDHTRKAAESLPYVREMMRAMGNRQRATAIKYGNSALLALRSGKTTTAYQARIADYKITVRPVGTFKRFWSITVQNMECRDLIEPIHDFTGTLDEAKLRAFERANRLADGNLASASVEWSDIELAQAN